MTSFEYVCAFCGGKFLSTWTNEEALAEMRDTFGDVAEDEQVVVCDVCYKLMCLVAPPEKLKEQQQ